MHLLLLLACSDHVLRSFDRDPLASISSPADGAALLVGETIPFVGAVSDSRGDASQELAVAWTSDSAILDQTPAETLGQVAFGTGTLEVGLHTITLRVTDSDQMSAAAGITVGVLAGPLDPTDTGEPAPRARHG